MTVAHPNTNTTKSAAKQPAAKAGKSSKVSPAGSPRSLEDEVVSLRARNKLLTETLSSIRETAEKEEKRLYDLVWFARNRSRFPNHESRHRIEKSKEHKEEIEKLKTTECDYYHGIHTGLLAASRLFKEQSDVLHLDESAEVTELMGEAAKHKQRIEESLKTFPHFEVSSPPQTA
eukprot:CAMPEP_0168801574 /NCGR_PEP_ID=MMETSP0725-20121227/19618_1 /TAXON_ID=265536 /ORGANISM="Amphiprora sp., Strain CCMP467" /LENGTH=174 /DNA_ID=CAMNT_0008853279 /DNA_START=53 /DNA_END=577 /DNA_ORIENTATION=-